MKQILALNLVVVLLMTVYVPAPSLKEYKGFEAYRDYQDSLYQLQKTLVDIHLELQQNKNPHAVYQHLLQSVEKTAVIMGKAELASQGICDGLQLSLKGKLELLLATGFSEEEKVELLNLGFCEEDIAEIMESLLYYNDHYCCAAAGFTPEEIEQFHALGLTDAHIAEFQSAIKDHYTEIKTNQQAIKQQQTELMYVQVSLSITALQKALELEEVDKGKGKGESDKLERLLDAEKKLLEAVRTVSEDQSSLENVKAFSKQVFKAAEQHILKGDKAYFLDFFIGLQVHCGALTALHGDPAFGLAEIHSYERALSECAASPERSIPPLAEVDEQSPSLESLSEEQHFTGEVEECDETNNKAWIIVVIKTPEDSMWKVVQILAKLVIDGLIELGKETLRKLLIKIGFSAAVVNPVTKIVDVVILIIMNTPHVGGGWVDHIPDDPTGTFDEIIIDEDTVAQIQRKAELIGCEGQGYRAVLDEPHQIVYSIWGTNKLYKSPNGHYFYYKADYSDQWVVEVEDMNLGFGRVVEAYKIECQGSYSCGGAEYEFIFEKWESCDGFIRLW